MQELFARERSSLFRYFVRLGRCEALAEDLLQNTFMSLWRYRSNFREGIKGPAYLYRVALNEWRQNHGREKRRQKTLETRVRERELAESPQARPWRGADGAPA